MDQIEGLEPLHENWGNITLGVEIDEGGHPPRVWAANGEDWLTDWMTEWMMCWCWCWSCFCGCFWCWCYSRTSGCWRGWHQLGHTYYQHEGVCWLGLCIDLFHVVGWNHTKLWSIMYCWWLFWWNQLVICFRFWRFPFGFMIDVLKNTLRHFLMYQVEM